MNRQKNIFYALYLTFVVAIIIAMLLHSKGEEILYINQFQSQSLDYFFRFMTWFGEIILLILLGVYLFLKNKKYLVYSLSAYLIQTVLVQGLKRITDLPRPLAYPLTASLTPIENTQKLLHGSFPSGHTATVFFLAVLIINYFKPAKSLCFLITLIAISVGISRMYLLVHFKEDVLAGSVIGVLMAELAHYFYLRNSQKL